MKPEAQRIAIAEACGLDVKLCPIHHAFECCGRSLPDYLNDLNAMHEVEKVLDKRQQDVFAGYLASIVQCGHTDYGALKVMATTKILFATAAQRAEAFLKTLNLWQTKDNAMTTETPINPPTKSTLPPQS